MIRSQGIIILLFLLALGTANAQKYKNYTVDNGLPSSEVFQVVQDHKGYIWIATNHGVVQFDGYKFKPFTIFEGLPENTILEIFEDYQNRLWFVSLSGKLSWYENDSIHIYPHNETIMKVKGQDYPIKKSFYVDSLDNVYIGFYRSALFKLDSTGKVKKYNTRDSLTLYAQSMNDNRVVYEFQKQFFRKLFYVQNENEYTIDFGEKVKEYRAISIEYNGYLLYGLANYLFVIKDGQIVYKHTFDDSIIWLSTDQNGLLWIGLLYSGAVALPSVCDDEKKYHLLKGNSVSSVKVDFEGGYWFTTLENGVFYYPTLNMSELTMEDGLPDDMVKAMVLRDSVLYFSLNAPSVFTYDFKKLKEHVFGKLDYELQNRYLEFIDDTLVISSIGNGKNSTSKTYFLKNLKLINEIGGCYSFICNFSKDNLLCFRHNKRCQIVSGEKEKGIKSDKYSFIYSIIQFERDSLWLGTDKGLFKMNWGTWEIEKVQGSELLRHRINVLYKDPENRIWIGTKGAGLLYFSKNKVKQMKIEDGLASNSISSIKRRDNELWLATNRGLSRIEINGDSLIPGSVVHISKGHGLVSDEVYDIELSKNKVIAATIAGISYFQMQEHIPEPPVYISHVKINGVDTSFHKNYVLEHDQNSIEIEYTAINYQRNKPVKYFYKLENIDQLWQETEDRNIRFSSLSPGNYTFKVKAINSFGKKSSQIAVFSFVIKKPYYQTAWFRIVSVLVALIIVFLIFYMIFRVKVRELRRRSKMEQELNVFRQQALSAQMNPHFIYNSLNSVQSYILKNERINSSEYLSKFGNLMRRVLNNSQKLTITLEEEIEALKLYVNMELMRFKNAFVFNLQIANDIALDRIFVPPMIIQPYVENAIHHGLRLKEGDKKLDVIIDKTEVGVYIIIQDNGIGRKKAAELQRNKQKSYKSYGTEITGKRLMLYNELYSNKVKILTNDLTASNHEETGTKVEIILSEALQKN